MCTEDFTVIRFNNIIDLGFKMLTWIKCDSVVSSCGLNLVCLWTNKVNEEVTVLHVSELLPYMVTSLTSLGLKIYEHIIQCDEHHGFFSRDEKLPTTSCWFIKIERKKDMKKCLQSLSWNLLLTHKQRYNKISFKLNKNLTFALVMK